RHRLRRRDRRRDVRAGARSRRFVHGNSTCVYRRRRSGTCACGRSLDDAVSTPRTAAAAQDALCRAHRSEHPDRRLAHARSRAALRKPVGPQAAATLPARLGRGGERSGLASGYASALVNTASAPGQAGAAAIGGALAAATSDAVPYLGLAGLCTATFIFLSRYRETAAPLAAER